MKPIESKRIALERKIVLRFPDFEGFVTEYSTNISMTGMFARSQEPQPAGTPVAFELRLEDGAPLVRGKGWVVWSRDRRQGRDRPAGMGIEFTELDRRSRRLVRWMILNQLPEGRLPFDVNSGTVSTPTATSLTARLVLGRNRLAGVLTAAAIFLGLASLIYWREFRTDVFGGDPAASSAGSEAAALSAGVSDPGPRGDRDRHTVAAAPAAEELSAGVGPAPSAEEVAAREAEEVVRSWARAWSDQAVDRYLEHYSDAFVPEAGLAVDAWREQRRQRLTAPESIRVAITRFEIDVLSPSKASVSFLQTYLSDGYADTVDKVLTLVLERGGWKIRRELAD